jgi:PleD family two-component response regulator
MARSFNKEKIRDKNIRTYELNRRQPKVLIVEENKISLVYLSEILKQRKIETDLAPNGALAIRMAKKRRVMTTLAAVV